MSFNEQDRRFMLRALEVAEQGRGYTEPNPMVGAVIVRDGRVLAVGHTRPFGGAHAEVVALEACGKAAEGATMYVTLEPCAHQGKTPPCAPRLVEAGLRRVVVAVEDPTPKTAGKGLAHLRRHGVETEVGLCREDAVRQNAAFFKMAAIGRPLVTAKWAMSADGKIATRTGVSRWISGEASRRAVHRERGVSDCIVVGGRTAALDDPVLTCRDAERRRVAARLVMCGRTAPAPDCRLMQTLDEAPVLLAYCEGSPPEGLGALVAAGCEALPLPSLEGPPGRVSPPALLDELGRRGMSNVLVEGGAAALGSFFDTGQVDRALAFVAPRIVGGGGAPSGVAGRGVERIRDAVEMKRLEVERTGGDVLLRGWIIDPVEWVR